MMMVWVHLFWGVKGTTGFEKGKNKEKGISVGTGVQMARPALKTLNGRGRPNGLGFGKGMGVHFQSISIFPSLDIRKHKAVKLVSWDSTKTLVGKENSSFMFGEVRDSNVMDTAISPTKKATDSFGVVHSRPPDGEWSSNGNSSVDLGTTMVELVGVIDKYMEGRVSVVDTDTDNMDLDSAGMVVHC